MQTNGCGSTRPICGATPCAQIASTSAMKLRAFTTPQIAEIHAAARTACGSLQPRPTLKRAAGDLSKRAPILSDIRGASGSRDHGLRRSCTRCSQVGYSRPAHHQVPISGKPEIGRSAQAGLHVIKCRFRVNPRSEWRPRMTPNGSSSSGCRFHQRCGTMTVWAVWSFCAGSKI
jgi:hypothetical protein